MESTSMPLAGYVWEEDGKIVGNTSLVFQAHRGRKLALIANVATHPSFRRRGIGRALTERAMLAARQKGAKEIWLQVRHDNPTAIKIYADLGFVERARRTTYHSRGAPAGAPAAGKERLTGNASHPGRSIVISRMSSRYWERQRRWLQAAHPDELAWYSRWDWDRLGPGLGNAMHRLFVQYDTRQWAATERQELLATVTWAPAYRASNTLWLAAAADSGEAVTTVLAAARHELAHFRRLTVEYPAGELREEIEAAGFEEFRTLLWMRATGNEFPRINDQKET
jgi:predicted GNAT family acetyltransferase